MAEHEISRAAPRERLITRPFVVVTLAALSFFVYIGMLVPIIPLFVEGPLGSGEFGIGLTIAVFAVAAIAARPVLGRIADRHGRRVIIVGGAAMAALGGALMGHVDSLALLLVLRSFTGIGEAAVFVGAATLIADLSPPDRRAESASYFSVAVFGGIGIGPVLGEWILADTRYERAFVVAAGFALLAALIACFAPRRVETPDDLHHETISPSTSTSAAAEKRPLIHPAAVLPGLVLASAVVGLATFNAFIPDWSRSVGLGGASALFALYSLVTLLVRIFGARLPERLGPRRAVTIALGNIAIGLLLFATVPAVPALFVGTVFLGLGVAFNYPSLMALTVNRAGERDRAAAVSSFTMFFEVGSVVGGLAIGAFAQAFGKQLGFLGGVAAALVGLWILRVKVVPASAPDAGPVTAPAPVRYVPVAGD